MAKSRQSLCTFQVQSALHYVSFAFLHPLLQVLLGIYLSLLWLGLGVVDTDDISMMFCFLFLYRFQLVPATRVHEIVQWQIPFF